MSRCRGAPLSTRLGMEMVSLRAWAEEELRKAGESGDVYYRYCPYCRVMTWHTRAVGQWVCTRKEHLDNVRRQIDWYADDEEGDHGSSDPERD